MSSPLRVRVATSTLPDVDDAVRELGVNLRGPDACGTLVFTSPEYPLDALGPALQAALPGPVMGCTSAAQLGPFGYRVDGISALTLYGDQVRLVPHLLCPLGTCAEQAEAIARQIDDKATGRGARGFGLLLVDGLSLMEERVTAALYQALHRLPIIGGSASDLLSFDDTRVLYEGEFLRDAAVLLHVMTDLPFRPIKFHHFEPSSRRLVITGADAERRLVHEINGKPAAAEYASLVGVDPAALDASVLSGHPFLLRTSGDVHVRSLAEARPDGVLRLFCAVSEGTVLSIGRSVDPRSTAMRHLAAATADLGGSPLVFGFDCILRHLQFEQEGTLAELGSLLASYGVFGFSTYGEQFEASHHNQTFTGVAVGVGR